MSIPDKDKLLERLEDIMLSDGTSSQRLRDKLRALMADVAIETLYDYAVHRDGVMWVGCGRLTYREAKAKLMERFGVEEKEA